MGRRAAVAALRGGGRVSAAIRSAAP